MSYEKHTWETGETITAEKLNNLENGVASGGGGIFIVEATNNEGSFTFNKTFDETINAYRNGLFVCMITNVQGYRYYLFLEEVGMEAPYYLTFERTQATLFYNAQNNDEMKDIASIGKVLFQWFDDGTYQYAQGEKMFV